jgi:hypothetical protein
VRHLPISTKGILGENGGGNLGIWGGVLHIVGMGGRGAGRVDALCKSQNLCAIIAVTLSEVRNQKSEIRSQKSEVRNQKSEIRNQKSEVRSQKSEVRQKGDF